MVDCGDGRDEDVGKTCVVDLQRGIRKAVWGTGCPIQLRRSLARSPHSLAWAGPGRGRVWERGRAGTAPRPGEPESSLRSCVLGLLCSSAQD